MLHVYIFMGFSFLVLLLFSIFLFYWFDVYDIRWERPHCCCGMVRGRRQNPIRPPSNNGVFMRLLFSDHILFYSWKLLIDGQFFFKFFPSIFFLLLIELFYYLKWNLLGWFFLITWHLYSDLYNMYIGDYILTTNHKQKYKRGLEVIKILF